MGPSSFPNRLSDPLSKGMLHPNAFSECEFSPAWCLMVKEVFQEEVGRQTLGAERTSEEAPEELQVAPCQRRWEKWSDAGSM